MLGDSPFLDAGPAYAMVAAEEGAVRGGGNGRRLLDKPASCRSTRPYVFDAAG